MPEPLQFYTGRADCEATPGLKGWETTKEEHHPHPQGNGEMTADFFKQDFGLTAREGAALLVGSHSFGTFNNEISQYKYDWTRKQSSLLNNQLFRYIMQKHFYLISFSLQKCSHEGSVLPRVQTRQSSCRRSSWSARCHQVDGPLSQMWVWRWPIPVVPPVLQVILQLIQTYITIDDQVPSQQHLLRSESQ